MVALLKFNFYQALFQLNVLYDGINDLIDVLNINVNHFNIVSFNIFINASFKKGDII
jgi:hypothetical protein